MKIKYLYSIISVSIVLFASCTPTVKIQAPEKPIEVNLNVKIDQQVRIKLDKDVEDLISDNPNIF